MNTFANDLRFAARSLRRSPVFAVAAILALGIGTGAASAVFSLLEGVVLRPLPYTQPDRLVSIWETNRQKGLEHEPISPVNFGDYRALDRVFESAAAWWHPQLSLADQSAADPIRVTAVEVSQNFFGVLGVQPNVGRGFSNAEKLYGGPAEVVISAQLFRSRFGGDRAALGRTVKLNGYEYALVGVMPDGFAFPGATDVWQGLSWDMAQHSRGAHFMEAVARLKPGVTPAMANAALAGATGRLGEQFQGTNQGWSARAVPLDREVAGVFRPALFALFGASGLLLLIACINVANLLLARAAAREREVAVRAALGATRARLVRLFLTESFVLAVIGSVLGLAFALAAVKGLLAWTPVQIPRADDAGVNPAVLAFSTIVATLTALTFGLAPALLMSRTGPYEGIKDGARGSGRGGRGRGALVVVEVTLAVMLLAGSGLLIRSVRHLLNESSGVDPVSVVTANIQLPERQYGQWERVDQFYTALVAALRARPEVLAAGATNFLPLEAAYRMPFRAADSPPPRSGDEPVVQQHTVDDGYFVTMRVPLEQGRWFDDHDVASGRGVVIVNDALAKQLWPGQNPIGKRIVTLARQVGPLGARLVAGNEHEVVGVIANVKNTSLKSPAEPAAYFSERQFPFRKMNIVVRSRGEPARVAAVLREEMRRLDPSLAAVEVKTMERVLAVASDPPRFVMLLMSVFAVLALSLAAVGIYGILNYAVSRRRREFAIRLALGAQPAGVMRNVVGEGLALAGLGCGLGVLGTVAGGRVLGGFLYQVKAWDGATIGVVLGLVMMVATAACLAPGWKAASEDPAGALRGD